MPTYTFRGGTSNNVWGATANWSPTGIPNGLDPVIFDNISPGVTINSAGAGCFSLNCTTGYTGTFTFENNGSANLGVGGITGGITTVTGLTFSSGMGITSLGPNGGIITVCSLAAGGTCGVTTNGINVPRLRLGTSVVSGAVNNYDINGSLNITQSFSTDYTAGPNTVRFLGGTVSMSGSSWKNWGIIGGNSTILLNPPPGTTCTFNSIVGAGSTPSGILIPLIINAPGATVNFTTALHIEGVFNRVAGSVTCSNPHILFLGGGNLNLIGMDQIQWHLVYTGYMFSIGGVGSRGTATSSINIGQDFVMGSTIAGGTNITFTSGSFNLNGARVPVGGSANYWMIATNPYVAPVRITGTGTRRILGSSGFYTASTFEIAMSSGTCIFTYPGATSSTNYFGFSGSTLTSTSVNTVIEGTSGTFLFTSPSASNLNIAGLTLGTATVQVGSLVNVKVPMVFANLTVGATGGVNITAQTSIGNNLVSGTGSYFTGTRGWTATNYTVLGGNGQGTILKAGLTYTVTGVFNMIGGGPNNRIALTSDTRADFTGSINATNLTVTLGTPTIGMIISQRSGQIPLQFGNLLPNRPRITAGGPSAFSITPGLAAPLGSTALAGGLPAYFTLLPGSSHTVVYATTQDINSSFGGPVFAGSSFNDTSGESSPSLYRTVNWGTLAAPGLPLAKTFCS